jgi:energy-coupling factor transport system permease protein
LDPRTKLVLLIAVTVLCAFIENIILLIAMGVCLFALMALSKILKSVFKFMIFFIIFWATAIIITTVITRDLAYSVGYFSPFFARFFIILSAGFLFAFTTPPSKLAQSLQKLKFPPSIIFTFTITLRYIPTLAREAESIINALKLRGIKIKGMDLIKRPSYFYRGIIIPLIIRTIKISDEVAIAAESRGFKANYQRSSLNEIKLGRNDFAFTITASTLLIFIIILDKLSLVSLNF